MAHVSDHIPAAAAVPHAALIAALDAGDLAGAERDRATTLVDSCPGCASLLADLAAIRAAIAALPATPRTRDYRLTEADTERLRPSPWRRLIGWLGAPRSGALPLAGSLAALGIAGLLLTATPGFFGQATSTLSTGANAPAAAAGAPASTAAPSATGGESQPAEANPRLGAAPNPPAGPAAAATGGPAATTEPGFAAATPGVAALPAPSPAAAALPAPAGTLAPGAPSGPAAAGTAEPSALSDDTGAQGSAPKAEPPASTPADRAAALTPGPQPAAPGQTLLLVVSLALLVAGVGLLVANRILRARNRA